MVEPVLEADGVTRVFTPRRTLGDLLLRRHPEELVAVDQVDLGILAGEALGIVGESGCGKSTLARCLLGLYDVTEGEVRFQGRPMNATRSLSDRRRIQMVFQDPYSSLNPTMTIGAAITEVLRFHRMVKPGEEEPRVEELLELVGLTPDIARSQPKQLSGGQRQRVSIARALAVEPEVLIADEPVSALDVSMQATVLNLLTDLRQQLGLTLILIAHDLSVVRYVCDRVAVMYLGRIVEQSRTDELFADPRHPYTRGLIDAAPTLSDRTDLSNEAAVPGDPPSPFAVPSGCRFRTRCPIATGECSDSDPLLAGGVDKPEHQVACHYAWNE